MSALVYRGGGIVTPVTTTLGGTGQNFGATAQGNVFYFSAAGVVSALVPGVSGQVLQTQGAAANPQWASVVTSAAGTTNQVAVSGSTGAVTWSLSGPHNFTTLTSGGILLGAGTGAITATAQLTNGQLLIGSTGANPVLAGLTQGTAITITSGAGAVTIANAGVTSASGTSNQVTVSGATGAVVWSLAGPHNFTTLTSNGVLYGNTTGAILATAQGGTNTVLTASAGAPSFSATPTLTSLTLTTNLTVNNGGNSRVNSTNSAFSKGAAIDTASILKVGGTGTADLTAVAGGAYRGLKIEPTFQASGGNPASATGMYFSLYTLADGIARTFTNLYSAYYDNVSLGVNVSATNIYGAWFVTPTGGLTTNRPIDSNSGGYLSGTGIWTDSSSRAFKDVQRRHDAVGLGAPGLKIEHDKRLAELATVTPVEYRYKPDHLIHPVRTLADLNDVDRERFTTLAQAHAAGLPADARWNAVSKQYEALIRGTWASTATDAKEVEFGVIAEDLPDIIRTKDGKGLNKAAAIAWLVAINQALLARLEILERRGP